MEVFLYSLTFILQNYRMLPVIIINDKTSDQFCILSF